MTSDVNGPVSVNLPFVILMKAAQSDRNVDPNLLLEDLVLGFVKIVQSKNATKHTSMELR